MKNSLPSHFKPKWIFVIITCLFLFQNCAQSGGGGSSGNQTNAISSKGSRELGFDILDTTPTSSFNDNISFAKSAGARFMILGLGWNQIESSAPGDCTTPGTYTDPGNALAQFNSLLPAANMKLSLSVFPISTNQNLMPSNLANRNFDDPLVVCRYQRMLNFVFSKIPNLQLTSFQFGNEIEYYPASNQLSFWSQYWSFFAQVSATAKNLRPGLSTSVVATLYGVTGLSANPLAQGGLQQIFNVADSVTLTYYPLNSDFTVKDLSVISSDVSAVLSLYPSKQIRFNEIGYPTGLSSEALQKQFVTEVFKTWDQFKSQISHVSFLRLNDISLSAAQGLAEDYEQTGNSQFIEYLRTLGFRTEGGADKQAFVQLKKETQDRGW